MLSESTLILGLVECEKIDFLSISLNHSRKWFLKKMVNNVLDATGKSQMWLNYSKLDYVIITL